MQHIPVSNGEVLDKLSILSIKKNHVSGTALENVLKEFSFLQDISMVINLSVDVDTRHELDELYKALQSVNLSLWNVEDALRNLEREKRFDEEFVSLARQVYYKNDERAKIKREINVLTNSGIFEEKSYEKY